jgi:hypothetical protein
MNKYAPSSSPRYYYYPHFSMYYLCNTCFLHLYASLLLYALLCIILNCMILDLASAFYGLLCIAYNRRVPNEQQALGSFSRYISRHSDLNSTTLLRGGELSESWVHQLSAV